MALLDLAPSDCPHLSLLCKRALASMGESFVAEENKTRILNFTNSAPKKLLIQQLVLESPLNSKEKWVDICLPINLQNAAMLSKKSRGWAQLLEFAQKWQKQNLFKEEFGGIKKLIWAEFDIGSAPDSLHLPSIFLTVPNILNIKSDFLGPILKECLSTSTPLLEKCAAHLLKSSWIPPHIGFMLSRNPSPIRINIWIKNPYFSTISEYLSRMGIDHFLKPLLNLLKKLECCVDTIALCPDIVDGVFGSKIGIECYITAESSTRLAKWRQYFDIVKTDCVIDTKKLESSLNWFGSDASIIKTGLYPPHVFLISNRTISHVKLVYSTAKGIEAKIYLSTNYYAKKSG